MPNLEVKIGDRSLQPRHLSCWEKSSSRHISQILQYLQQKYVNGTVRRPRTNVLWVAHERTRRQLLCDGA